MTVVEIPRRLAVGVVAVMLATIGALVATAGPDAGSATPGTPVPAVSR